MNDDAVRDLARRAGIAVEWKGYAGRPHSVAPDVLRRILEALGLPSSSRGDLVASRKQGREKLHVLNPAPIQEIADRWMGKFDRRRIEALADLKRALEGEPGT